MSTGPVHLIVDASAGVAPLEGRLATLAPDGHDSWSPSRRAFLDAFLAITAEGPHPHLCIVGPYGDVPTHTSANGGRKDMASKGGDPDRVRILNVGKSFLGLGLIARALAESRLSAAQAMAWLDDAAPATTMWLVLPSSRLVAAGPDAHVDDVPQDADDHAWSLLRVRHVSKYVGGFTSVRDAVAAAVARTAVPENARGLVAPGLGLDAAAVASLVPALAWDVASTPPQLAHLFGDCLAFAIGPTP